MTPTLDENLKLINEANVSEIFTTSDPKLSLYGHISV